MLTLTLTLLLSAAPSCRPVTFESSELLVPTEWSANERWILALEGPEGGRVLLSGQDFSVVRKLPESKSQPAFSNDGEALAWQDLADPPQPRRVVIEEAETGAVLRELQTEYFSIARLAFDTADSKVIAFPHNPLGLSPLFGVVWNKGAASSDARFHVDGSLQPELYVRPGFAFAVAQKLSLHELRLWRFLGDEAPRMEPLRRPEPAVRWAVARKKPRIVLGYTEKGVTWIEQLEVTPKKTRSLGRKRLAVGPGIGVATIEVSRDGARVAVVVGEANGPGAVLVLDWASGTELLRFPAEWTSSEQILLAPSGKRLLRGTGKRWTVCDIPEVKRRGG